MFHATLRTLKKRWTEELTIDSVLVIYVVGLIIKRELIGSAVVFSVSTESSDCWRLNARPFAPVERWLDLQSECLLGRVLLFRSAFLGTKAAFKEGIQIGPSCVCPPREFGSKLPPQ